MLNSTPIASLADANSTSDQPQTISHSRRSVIQAVAWQTWLGIAATLLLLIGIYWRVGIKLFHDWLDFPGTHTGCLSRFSSLISFGIAAASSKILLLNPSGRDYR